MIVKRIPRIVYIATAIITLLAVNTNFFEEILAASLLLIFIFYLFWQENTPPVLLFGSIFQWISITIGYIYMLFSDVAHQDLLRRPFFAIDNINRAYWLSILGLFLFVIGLKSAISNLRLRQVTKQTIEQYDTIRVIIFYVFYNASSDFLFRELRFTIPGLAEPLHVLSFFKWSLFFMMIYLSSVRNEHRLLVFLVVFSEVVIGFSGFFSEFKEVLILYPIVYLSFNKLKIKQLIVLSLLVFFVVNIGIVWSYVKVEQRMFLSGGSRAQVVKVSKIDALKNLYQLTSEFNAQKYKLGLNAMVQRLYYIEYFSATIRNIPAKRDFMNGEILQEALKHVLMPRIFFPNKKYIDDSKQTTRLTGIHLANQNQGTSISAGYMAESYADFGSFYMFIEIFLIGFAIGYTYKTLINRSLNSFWSMAIVFPMFFLTNINGVNLIKIVGRIIMFFIVFLLINKFILPLLNQILLKSRK